MAGILRHSPVKFDLQPAVMEEKQGWQVVQEYLDQKKGPLLIDLSHTPSWYFQDKDLSSFTSLGLKIPSQNNGITRQGNLFVSRMNDTQCQVWSLDSQVPAFVDTHEMHCTQITDGQAVLGLVGENVQGIVETFTPQDVFAPDSEPMGLFQAPLFHIPCQILVLDRSEKIQVILIACPRGYGNDMARAILKSGDSQNLGPGGEKDFLSWLNNTEF